MKWILKINRTFILLIAIICGAFNAFAATESNAVTPKKINKNVNKKTKKKVILYPKFLITYAADFGAFKTYMNESKEEYRSRRAAELISQSKSTARQFQTFSNQTANGNGNTSSQSSSEISTSGADPEIAALMMQAYNKFDYSYELNKQASRKNIGQELAGQLQAKLSALQENNLISEEDSNINITHGKYASDEMDDRLDNAAGYETEGRSGSEMAEVANHFLYGHWSYYSNENSDKKDIKVTIFIEEIGGNIKTFEAIGSEQGEAMSKIAKMIFTYLHSNKNYTNPVASFGDLEVVRPNTMDDTKSHREAASFCTAQGEGFRLPYAKEVTGMISQPFGPDGKAFLSSDKSYAISDLQGGASPLKVVPNSDKDKSSSLQNAQIDEKLSYFCVKGDEDKIGSVDKMYSDLYSEFSELRSNHDDQITPELCSDEDDTAGIAKIKNMVVRIATTDLTPKIKAVVKHCTIAYLKKRPDMSKELNLVRKL